MPPYLKPREREKKRKIEEKKGWTIKKKSESRRMKDWLDAMLGTTDTEDSMAFDSFLS